MKENLKYICNTNEDYNEAYYLMDSLKSHSLNGTASELNLIIDPKYDIRLVGIEELRELAKPCEYLDENFKLQVTNQPKEGWRLVPDGAEYYKNLELASWFYKVENSKLYFWDFGGWCVSGFADEKSFKKILWQRTPQQETIMEKKGRFLHQEWYEAFGRGEDLLLKMINNKSTVLQVNSAMGLHIFDDANNHFSLKPQTIQIGSRTINKPISVKPEIGQEFYVSSIASIGMALSDNWKNSDSQNEVFNRNLCHLTKEDAISHTEALLELMK